jgi:hypothetical protein
MYGRLRDGIIGKAVEACFGPGSPPCLCGSRMALPQMCFDGGLIAHAFTDGGFGIA